MAAPAAAAPAATNPYGIIPALQQGGLITQFTFGILVIMSVGVLVHLLRQAVRAAEDHQARAGAPAPSSGRPADACATAPQQARQERRLSPDRRRRPRSPIEQHDKLTDPIDQHDWMLNSLARSQGAITSRLTSGLAVPRHRRLDRAVRRPVRHRHRHLSAR